MARTCRQQSSSKPTLHLLLFQGGNGNNTLQHDRHVVSPSSQLRNAWPVAQPYPEPSTRNSILRLEWIHWTIPRRGRSSRSLRSDWPNHDRDLRRRINANRQPPNLLRGGQSKL